MKLQIEHANITVKSIQDAIRFLSAAFPDFVERGGKGRWAPFR